jgi:outer membrane protein assembly factor BamB
MHRIATTRRAFLGSAASALILAPAGAAWAADWPMYRNATHDGHSDEKINTQWPANGPRVVWKVPMGPGFSAVSAAGNRAYVNAKKDGAEYCYCLDAATGKTVWAKPMDQRTIHDTQGGDGPRSTPTIDDGKVYLLGTYLKLLCLDAATGDTVWQHDMPKEYKGQLNARSIKTWGSASSAIIDGDLVFVSGGGPGETFMAFDKRTGEVKWKHGDEVLTHATPTIATIDGVRQVIFVVQSGLVSCEPATGHELWKFPIKQGVSKASSPVVGGDLVFVSSAYSVGASVCKVTKSDDGKFVAQEVWRTPNKLMNHWNTPVFADGYLYGLYKEPASLRCLEMATGKELWSALADPEIWRGGTVYVDGCVLVQGEKGDLFLVEATPQKFNQLGHCKPVDGKCWTMPTVANGRIYCRSDREVACLDVATEA